MTRRPRASRWEIRCGLAMLALSWGLAMVGQAQETAAPESKPESKPVEHLPWHDNYAEALAEAEATGKPIFLEFRCAPCVNGRQFDAQVLYTPADSPRGELLSKFVRARITSMSGVDIRRYERDWHNSLYYFVINAEEDIYLRYGGRDETSADAYLNLESLELALQAGLKEHARYEKGERESDPNQPPLRPSDYELLKENVIDVGRCTECHLIADYSMQEKALAGLLDPIEDLYRSPDIKRLGLQLDVPKGLVLREVTGAAQDAGIAAGDVIQAINGQRVLTFGDLQYRYDAVPRRSAKSITLTVARGGETLDYQIQLPFEWWKTGLEFRHWTVEPHVFFEATPLSEEEKQEAGLPTAGFASRVHAIDIEAVLSDFHALEVGDVIVAVNKQPSDPMTQDVISHIKLHYPADTKLSLEVLRGDERLTLPLQTRRLNFRKTPAEDKDASLTLNWSDPDYVTSGADRILRYRGAIANGHLIVEARHEPGWHSYAMDNPARAKAKLGSTTENQDLPTVITLPEGLAVQGGWLQTPPKDYSTPHIHWHTWGFEGRSYFAIALEKRPEEAVKLQLSSQVCDAQSCAGVFDLHLTVPAPPAATDNLYATMILRSLEPVLPAVTEE